MRANAAPSTAPIVAAVVVLTMFAGAYARVTAQDDPPAAAPQKLTFEGDAALLTVAIKPDKTADFEQIMTRLFDALRKSPDPIRRQQAAGWKVMRIDKPLPDGNIAYVHVVSPVVSGADYAVMQNLYEAYPDERQALYDLYRGAFVKNLSLAMGSVPVMGSPASE